MSFIRDSLIAVSRFLFPICVRRGPALVTLCTADIGEYGIDGGRGLPQLQESEAWWKSIADTLRVNRHKLPT